MSDSDDDFAYFGTPLEQFDEDTAPKKKPIGVGDQVAIDKHGRRRFHGAFTGGFSAGFFNSVGSLEGWKPSAFKSSRGERSSVLQQLPSHFMDDEDTDEFGIAPQVLRTKSDYASAKQESRKRSRQDLWSEGPVPGLPVLETLLKPASHTIGILLLMKMGWKPGDDIGEKIEGKRKTERPKRKVYGCARGPQDDSIVVSDSDSEVEDEIYRELGKRAPSFVRKEDTMGLGYKGLDRDALSFGRNRPQPVTFRDQFRKSIKISGQAFGVGAFEEDDDDIYATEDKSQYDFSLQPLHQKKERPSKTLAVSDGSNIIPGFVKASFKETAKQYPGPTVPSTFTGVHLVRRSRFDPAPADVAPPDQRRQRLDADLRGVILSTDQPPIRIKEEKPDEDVPQTPSSHLPAASESKKKESPSDPPFKSGSSWKPFADDPSKQERYERYLNLIKIGAKDLVHTVLLNTMSDLERESELREFEGAGRLYTGNLMSDRFTHGDETGIVKPEPIHGEKKPRITSDWSPHPLICKRFNIKPPDTAPGTSLKNAAENRKKPKFSVFDFLDTSKSSDLLSMVQSNASSNNSQPDPGDKETEFEVITGQAITGSTSTAEQVESVVSVSSKPSSSTANLGPFDDDEFEEPADKMDLFKAIFLDSDEEDGDEENRSNAASNEKKSVSSLAEPVNILRNTSPPRGIFANLDLDKLSNRVGDKGSNVLKLTEPPQSVFPHPNPSEESNARIKAEDCQMPEDCYGPILPVAPLEKPKARSEFKLDVKDERWVEKAPKEKRHKTKHRRKKHKKEKKKEKHKKKKKKYSSDSDSSSSES